VTPYTPTTPCRCGYNGTGTHRCHVGRGTPRQCPNDGVEQLVAYPTALAGVTMKLGAADGCYCVQHWAEFKGGVEYPTDLSSRGDK
jgi:hypothetical protein